MVSVGVDSGNTDRKYKKKKINNFRGGEYPCSCLFYYLQDSNTNYPIGQDANLEIGSFF